MYGSSGRCLVEDGGDGYDVSGGSRGYVYVPSSALGTLTMARVVLAQMVAEME